MNQPRFYLTMIASVIITSLLTSSVAFAQNDTTQLTDEHSQKIKKDQEVITVVAPSQSPLKVTSSLKQPRQPVPASDGSDYLKTIPGFSQIRNGGTNGDPIFRGMFGSRLRILTDGGEMLGACPARMDAPTSYISPENYDALTLIKGPETVLWGPGNSAGTLRFEHEQPDFTHHNIQGTASILAASNSRYDENADVSVGNNTGYFRMIGNKSRSNNYEDGDGKTVASKWDKWNSNLTVGLTPDDDTLLELSAGKGDGEASYAGRKMDGSQFKHENLNMRFKKEHIGQIFTTFEANAYYNYANHVMDNYSLRSSSGMTMSMNLDRRTAGGRLMGTWQWEKFKLQSGADTQQNTHRKNSSGTWIKDAKFQNVGLFEELTWSAHQQYSLISGARLDQVLVDNYTSSGSSGRDDIMPSGFVRLEHSLIDKPVMVYAGLGYTERFPDYWELFSPTYGPGGDTVAFDSLSTEKTTQIDIGAQYKTHKANAWISAYVGRVTDFILFRYNENNAKISQADNVNATTMGAETGINYQLSTHWKTEGSLAYSWAKNTDDNTPLPQIPPLEARLSMTWQQENWTATGLARLVSAQTRIAENEGNVVGKDFSISSGFSVFSANTSYTLNSNVKLSAGVDNIFDKTYSEHLNLAGNSAFGYSADTSVNEPGRTFWAKLNIDF